MKSIILGLLFGFSFTIFNAQISSVTINAKVHEDKVNDLVFIYGLTKERKACITMLDANFNIKKEYLSDEVIGKKDKAIFELRGMVKSIHIKRNKSKVLNSIHLDNELNQITLNYQDEIYIKKRPDYKRGNFGYFVQYEKTEEGKKYLIKNGITPYEGDLKISCAELRGSNILTSKSFTLPITDVKAVDVLNVIDDSIYFFVKFASNSIGLYKCNTEDGEIISTKTVTNASDAESTTYDVSYDVYRKRFYVSFVENLGRMNEDRTSKIFVNVLDQNFESIQDPIEFANSFPVDDCNYLKTKKGVWDNYSRTDNVPIVICTRDLVSISVFHSQQVIVTSNESPAGFQEVNNWNMLVGLTDIVITDGNVESSFYNKETIVKQRELFSSLRNKKALFVHTYRVKFFKNNKPYYVLIKNGSAVEFVDLNDYKNSTSSKLSKFIIKDAYFLSDPSLCPSRFIQSKDQTKLLEVVVTDMKYIYSRWTNTLTSQAKFKIVIEEL